MRQLIVQILLSLVFYSWASGQKNNFNLTGTIRDCKSKKPIEGVTIILSGNNKTSIETKSNKEGYYSFANCFGVNVSYLVSTKVTEATDIDSRIKYGVCPYENYEGYINTSHKYKFETLDSISNKNLVSDFCLVKVQIEYRFPDFFFQTNSTEFFKPSVNGFVSEDTTIDCFVGLLMLNKTWVIEMSGHSDSFETNPQNLSKERVEKIRDILVRKGIDTRRLVIRYYGSSRMMQPEDSYYKENVPLNSRVVISVLRNDFDSK